MSPEVRFRWRRVALRARAMTAALRPTQLFNVHRAQSNGEVVPTYDGFKVDTWAIGITLHILLRGEYPFDGQREGLTMTRNGTLSKELLEALRDSVIVSPECTDFITQCFTFDGAQRPTAEQLASHPWMQGTVPAEARPSHPCMIRAVPPSDRDVRAGARRCGGRPRRDGQGGRRPAPHPAGPALSEARRPRLSARCMPVAWTHTIRGFLTHRRKKKEKKNSARAVTTDAPSRARAAALLGRARADAARGAAAVARCSRAQSQRNCLSRACLCHAARPRVSARLLRSCVSRHLKQAARGLLPAVVLCCCLTADA